MKLLLIISIAFFGLYLACAGLLFALQRQFIYHPTPVIQHPLTERIIHSTNADIKLIIQNPQRVKALIYFPGNAEAAALTAAEFHQLLPSHTIYFVAYRGYSGSTGTPTEHGLKTDAAAIYDQLSIKHRQISVIGRSLGSGIACWLAANRSIEKLILVTPYDSIERLAKSLYPIFPVGLLLQDKYESFKLVADLRVPTLSVLAEFDATIPRSSSARLLEAFTTKPKNIVLNNTTHNDLHNHPNYYQAIASFLQSS